MSNYERMELLWEYLIDFDRDAFVYPEEIENGEAYLDAEKCEIVLSFDNKKCKVTIQDME